MPLRALWKTLELPIVCPARQYKSSKSYKYDLGMFSQQIMLWFRLRFRHDFSMLELLDFWTSYIPMVQGTLIVALTPLRMASDTATINWGLACGFASSPSFVYSFHRCVRQLGLPEPALWHGASSGQACGVDGSLVPSCGVWCAP